jgi:trimethylamine--corrinoid protein Co-methyltransferase
MVKNPTRNYYRLPFISNTDINQIHDATMDLLENMGVAFHSADACEVFKRNGFKVDGRTVFFKEAAVCAALENAPSHFALRARNADHSVDIGQDALTVAPGYGAPYLITSDGERRKGTFADYQNFCKLIQGSESIDINGFLMIEPTDVPARTAHLDMMLANILLCDKPFMSSAASRACAEDCIKMLTILFGELGGIGKSPVSMVLINARSPMQYAKEMVEALMVYAKYRQVCVISSLIMAASSGPVNLPGVIALQNAEVLAGITLAQTVNPGTPVIYGGASAPIDMRTGGVAIGAPEVSQIIAATAQLARYYRLPSRSGGCLTDANFPDAQAGAESALSLHSALMAGINFILHACGILGSYLAMSYEKFVIDEEIIDIVKKSASPLDITPETIDLQSIKDVGIGGHYITQPKTRQGCWTEFYMPALMRRRSYNKWYGMGKNRIDELARREVRQRLKKTDSVPIDTAIASELRQFVDQAKANHT